MNNKKFSLMNAKNVLLIVMVIALVASVYATVTYNSASFAPANNSFTNNDATKNFTFNVSSSINTTVNCTLIIDAVAYGNITADNNTLTGIVQNASLAEGAHLWYIECNDSETVVTYGNFSLTVDVNAPTVTIINTSYNTTNTQPAIDFNVSDVYSTNLNCTLYFNHVAVQTNTTSQNQSLGLTTIAPSSAQDEGAYGVYVNCTDNATNQGQSSNITIKIDTTSPVTNMMSISINTSNDSPDISFNYTDAVSPTANCVLYFDATAAGSNATVINYTATTITASAQTDGVHTVYVNCTDHLGFVNKSSEITITTDTLSPVTVLSNTSINTSSSTPGFTFYFNDSISQRANCTLYFNGVNASVNDTVLNGTSTVLTAGTQADGTYTVYVNCTDVAGWKNKSNEITVGIDATAPKITIQSPLNNSISTTFAFSAIFNGTSSTINNASINVTITGYDGTAYYYNYSNMSCDNYLATTDTINCTFAPTLGDNRYNMTISVADTVGGSSVTTTGANVSIDNLAPTVQISNPAGSAWTNDNTTAITFNFSDAVSTWAACNLIVNGALSGGNNFVANYTATIVNINGSEDAGLADGIGYSLSVNCTDHAGKIGQATVQLLNIDTENPTVNMLTTSYNTTDTTPSVAFNFTDALATNATCKLWMGGTAYEINATTLNNTWMNFTANTTLSDGTYVTNVTCTDNANNNGTSTSINIKIDTGAPTVNILSTDTNTTDDTPDISFNYTDALSPTANCTVYFNDVSAGNNATAENHSLQTITVSSQEDNIYTVYVNCTDDMGMVDKSSEITFKIDSTGPTVTLSSPADGATAYNVTEVVFSFYDALTPNASCTVFVNDTAYGTNGSTTNNSETTITLNTSVVESSYTLEVNCTDVLGNIGTTSQALYIDWTAPTINDTIGKSGTTSTTSSGTATMTVRTDENATCWYKSTDFNAINITGATQLSGNGTSTHTFSQTYTATGNIGPFYISCMDTAGNNMTTSNSTGSIAVTVTTSTSGGGGGGGGGGMTNPSTSQTWDQVTPGVARIMKVSSDDYGIKEITIEVNNPANSVKIVIEKLAGKPASVTQSIEGKVFRYLNIKPTNLVDSNIKGVAKLKFQVTQSWLLANGVNADNVVLKRYVNGAWQDLKTKLLSKDSKYAYYEAETPGFSYFAIGEKSTAAPAPVTPPEEQPPVEQPPAEQPPEEQPPVEQPPVEQPPAEQPPAEKKPSNLANILVMIVVVLAIVLIIIAITRKRKPKQRLFSE